MSGREAASGGSSIAGGVTKETPAPPIHSANAPISETAAPDTESEQVFPPAPLAIWRIQPLPDFLNDPSLTGDTESERLPEYCSGWVQFVGSLWGWSDRATFALRFFSSRGGIAIYFCARPHDAADEARLRGEVDVLLRTHKLLTSPDLARVFEADFRLNTALASPAVVRVRQRQINSLWRSSPAFQNNVQNKQRLAFLSATTAAKPSVIYPWRGPGGPFLVPMESLLSQPVPCSITVILEPTQLRRHEWDYLALMAQHAQSMGEQNHQEIGAGAASRTVDPSAKLAGELYMSSLRRLSSSPFLATVYCAAADDRQDVAVGLAGAMQSLVHEAPEEADAAEGKPLPCGADLVILPPPSFQVENPEMQVKPRAPIPPSQPELRPAGLTIPVRSPIEAGNSPVGTATAPGLAQSLRSLFAGSTTPHNSPPVRGPSTPAPSEQLSYVPKVNSTAPHATAQHEHCARITAEGAVAEAAWLQFEHLRNPQISEQLDLDRLADLCDAKGAATVFRLPVSVRGGVPGIAVRQLPPDFHPGERIFTPPPRSVRIGDFQAGGHAYIPIDDLCKHALVVGFTGSGKSVTTRQLIHQAWIDHDVPFLVLESAKQEYRGFITSEEFVEKGRKYPAKRVRSYTLGNETCAPFRINPFELLPGVRVEAHLGKLQACLEGAIPPIGPSSSVIQEALLRVYENEGWSLTDVYPLEGSCRRSFPVLKDFVNAVECVLAERDYQGEVKSNLTAALVGRFRPLLLGGKGRMFDAQRSAPSPEALFECPVILEMNDLIVEDKALMVMFVLMMLREYRENHKCKSGELVHLTVVEEAHNVLEQVSSEGSGEGATKADTRHKAVESFCAMLTEIRSLGEGLIIADQSPEKLARDALRNTNLQLAHQLRDGKDRESVANAMIMEEEQRDFLGKLRPGQAAMFRTGLEKATFVQVQLYTPGQKDEAARPASGTPEETAWCDRFRGRGFNALIPDSQVRAYMDDVDPAMSARRRLALPFLACDSCASQCRYRDLVFGHARTGQAREAGRQWFALTDVSIREQLSMTVADLWQEGADLAKAALRELEDKDRMLAGLSGHLDAGWCYYAHMYGHQLLANGWCDADEGLDTACRSLFEAAWMTATQAQRPALSTLDAGRQ